MARQDPQFNLRIPTDIRDWIAQQAKKNGSSQTSEVIRSIRERMERVERKEAA